MQLQTYFVGSLPAGASEGPLYKSVAAGRHHPAPLRRISRDSEYHESRLQNQVQNFENRVPRRPETRTQISRTRSLVASTISVKNDVETTRAYRTVFAGRSLVEAVVGRTYTFAAFTDAFVVAEFLQNMLRKYRCRVSSNISFCVEKN